MHAFSVFALFFVKKALLYFRLGAIEACGHKPKRVRTVRPKDETPKAVTKPIDVKNNYFYFGVKTKNEQIYVSHVLNYSTCLQVTDRLHVDSPSTSQHLKAIYHILEAVCCKDEKGRSIPFMLWFKPSSKFWGLCS